MLVAFPILILASWITFAAGLPVEVTLLLGALALLDAIAVGLQIVVGK